MTIKTKLTFMPYAQATVIIDNKNNITLRSYFTDVVYLDNEGFLTVTGLYSMTTRKHIGAFMKEYTPNDFSMAKRCYEGKFKYNIYTGEIVDL